MIKGCGFTAFSKSECRSGQNSLCQVLYLLQKYFLMHIYTLLCKSAGIPFANYAAMSNNFGKSLIGTKSRIQKINHLQRFHAKQCTCVHYYIHPLWGIRFSQGVETALSCFPFTVVRPFDYSLLRAQPGIHRPGEILRQTGGNILHQQSTTKNTQNINLAEQIDHT